MTESHATTVEAGQPDSYGGYAIRVSRVRWLIGIRWLGILAMAGIGCLLLWFGREPHADSLPVLFAAGALFLHNFAAKILLPGLVGRSARPGGRSLSVVAATIIAMDMFAWIFVMHNTGGVINPLAVVPVFIAGVSASLLPERWVKNLMISASLAIIGAALLENGFGFYQPGWSLFAGVTSDRWADGNLMFLVGVYAGGICLVMILSAYLTNAILARLRRINRRLVAANRELSALDAIKSRFLRISSHQLRGPVSAIHTLVSAIQQVGALSPKQYDLMRKLHARCDDIIRQLDEMLLLGTIREKTGESRDLRPVEISSLVTETVRLAAEQIAEKNLSVAVSSPKELYAFGWGDALNIVFSNIIGNAVKYTGSGGRITVTAGADDGGNVVVKVADTGIGIPADQQGQVFKEFFRGTNAQQICGGTGMGLSIVKEIVDELGGAVSLNSAVGEGTTVTVTLPAAGRTHGETRQAASTMKGHTNVAADTQ